jgi:hypothetical protein
MLGHAFLKAHPLIQRINADIAATPAANQLDRLAKCDEMHDVLRSVFRLSRDESGLTVLEAAAIADDFLVFLREHEHEMSAAINRVMENANARPVAR